MSGRDSRLVTVEVESHEHYVELLVRVGGQTRTGVSLHYPRQGQVVGEEPRHDRIARELNEAAAALNAKLAEWCT